MLQLTSISRDHFTICRLTEAGVSGAVLPCQLMSDVRNVVW